MGVKVGEAIAGSFGFVGTSWRGAPAALWLLLAVVIANRACAYVRWPGASALQIVLTFFQLVLVLVVTGALYRVALRRDHPGDPDFRPGPGGVQWGAIEWRVLGASLIVGALIGVLAFVLLLGWAVVLGVMIENHLIDPGAVSRMEGGGPGAATALLEILKGPAGIASLAIVLPGVALIAYLTARLGLFVIRTAETGRFSLGAAWSLTRGATGAMIVGWLALFGIELLIGMLIGLLSSGLVAGIEMAPGAPKGLTGGMFARVAGAAIDAAFSTPLGAGLVTFIYRTQRGDLSVAEAFA